MPYDALRPVEYVRLGSEDVVCPVSDQLAEMLMGSPKKLHTSLAYDEEGSEMFEMLCAQPEYYLTRTERRLLYDNCERIVQSCRSDRIIDLGCGNIEKTQIIINECVRQGKYIDLVPCDIDESIIRTSLDHLLHFYKSTIRIQAIVGCFEDCIKYIKDPSKANMFLFLGSTLGNMKYEERNNLFSTLHDAMGSRDNFVLGIDLIKDKRIIEAAYNDAAGYLKKNIMSMIRNLNRHYGGRFDMENFDHISRYEPETRQVVSYIISKKRQTVPIEKLGIEVEFGEGEEIEAEIREKFYLHEMIKVLQEYGFRPRHIDVDQHFPYAVIVSGKDTL